MKILYCKWYMEIIHVLFNGLYRNVHTRLKSHRFSAKKTSMFTLSGRRQPLLQFTICPVALKALSEGTDVAGIARYFLATEESIGNLVQLTFHHSKGNSLTGSSAAYLLTSALPFPIGS